MKSIGIAKKQVNFEDHGVKCHVDVFSVIDEYQLLLEAFVRSVAVDAGVLNPLWSKADLVGARSVQTIAVDEEVLASSRLARTSLAGALDNETATAANISRVLSSKYTWLSQVDKWFKVEQAFWVGSMDTPGVERMYDMILECLPTETADITLGQSDVRLKRLSGSKLLQFCGTSMQSVFASIHGFAVAISQGRAPNMSSATGSHFIVKVKIAMGRYCTYEETKTVDDNEVTTTLYGNQAINAMWKEVKTKHQNEYDLSLTDLKPLQVYGCMLTDEERREVKALTNSVVASLGRVAATTGVAEPKRSAAQKSADGAKELAGSLFKSAVASALPGPLPSVCVCDYGVHTPLGAGFCSAARA